MGVANLLSMISKMIKATSKAIWTLFCLKSLLMPFKENILTVLTIMVANTIGKIQYITGFCKQTKAVLLLYFIARNIPIINIAVAGVGKPAK